MKNLQPRSTIIKGVFIIMIMILLIDLFIIQVLNSEYKYSAENNSIRYEAQPAARGLIYDRNNTLLVSNAISYDLMVIPREVSKIDEIKLCKLIGISLEDFRMKLQEAFNYSEYKESLFSKQLDKISAAIIKESLNEFNGFYIRQNTTRDYRVQVAAHALGFLGEINNEETVKHKYFTKGDAEGKTGIEASYDEELRGKKGMKIMLVDSHNRPHGSFKDGHHDSLAIVGRNIITTLDIHLQKYGEKLMTNKIGAIVAIEPSTGEILSLITSPNYNPNMMKGRERSKNYLTFSQDPKKILFNRALSGSYPPASSFKLINALIALEEETLIPENVYYCKNSFEYGNNRLLRCHDHKSNVNLYSAIKVSCNSYFCHLWENLFEKYQSKIAAYISWSNHVKSFGLGGLLNNDFTIGQKGNIPDIDDLNTKYNRWNSSTLLNMAIGQGDLLVTPIQMANLVATIANRGYYYTPHIVKSIEDSDIPKRFTIKNYTSISPKYFEHIIIGMESVLEDSDGSAFASKVNNLSICGKTGTAQNPHGEDHSIFIAFAPKENPQIAISVYVENGTWGSMWAAPIATLMMEKYLTGNITNRNMEEKMLNGNLINQN